MVTPAKPFSLTVQGPADASFVVRRTQPGIIARVTSGEPPTHVVTGAGIEHRLSQPWAPDDGMSLELAPRGEPARHAVRAKLPEEIEWAYMEWAEGSRAERNGALLAELPEGAYRLVRTKLRAREHGGGQLLLGNERIPSPPNAIELLDDAPLYAAAVGARADALPSGTTPLVGLAVLDYVGDSVVDGVLFFELAEADASANADADADADADVVVVVPLEGPLVIDVLEGFSADAARVARERWKSTRAEALVRRLVTV